MLRGIHAIPSPRLEPPLARAAAENDNDTTDYTLSSTARALCPTYLLPQRTCNAAASGILRRIARAASTNRSLNSAPRARSSGESRRSTAAGPRAACPVPEDPSRKHHRVPERPDSSGRERADPSRGGTPRGRRAAPRVGLLCGS